MSLLTIGRGPASYNYYVLRGILDDAVLNEVRAVAKALPRQGGIYSRSAANTMFAYLDRMPLLSALLPQLLDDLHCIGTNFFCSDPTNPSLSDHGEWHTGHSLYFGVKGGVAMTMWIPLQDVNEETGGRLKMYNGEYISQIDELLQCQVRNVGNSISNKHSLLQYLNHELEDETRVENMSVGDVLIFDEMLPHQAEKCLIEREVLAIRLVIGDFSLDRELIQSVIDRYNSQPGEVAYAVEYLENLLKHGEYDFAGAAERSPGDLPREDLPVGVSPARAMVQRVKARLRPGA